MENKINVWNFWNHKPVMFPFPQPCLTLGCFQEMVVGARRMHRGTVGRDGRRSRGDGGNGTGAKCIDVQEILKHGWFIGDLVVV